MKRKNSKIQSDFAENVRLSCTNKNKYYFELFQNLAFFVVLVSVIGLCSALTEAEEITRLKNDMKLFVNQVQMTEMNQEVNNRITFSSGVVRTRQYHDATKNYLIESIAGGRMLGMHEHSNHHNTVGLGELEAILNGVTFRTRHNDYKLKKPHSTSEEYAASETIEYPEVPPTVLEKKTVADQIAEMRLWFKAFADEDHSERDYRKYFKSVLCYLEGAWTWPSKDGKIVETATSDRHGIDAAKYSELNQKVMFNELTGHKNNGENYALLPTRIIEIVDGTTPRIAQWNYRIMCHPTDKFVLKSRLRPVDDLHLRLPGDVPLKDYELFKKARFALNADDSTTVKEGKYTYGFLDKLMGEIPGYDNYQGKLEDKAYNVEALGIGTKKPLDASKYHRWYETREKGAMGDSIKHKGFNDNNVFMAMTTQEQIADLYTENHCKYWRNGTKTCQYTGRQRWSYAIPLELIYLTPLGSWNPHNIEYHGDANTEDGAKVTAGGRNGDTEDKDKAYDGTNSKTFYRTPAAFFSGSKGDSMKADTVAGAVGVLNKARELVTTVASGVEIITANIPGVGQLRTRYPIAPLADDGKIGFKELNAIKDFVLWPSQFRRINNETEYLNKDEKSTAQFKSGRYQMSYYLPEEDGDLPAHTHATYINVANLNKLLKKSTVSVTTSMINKHKHKLTLKIKGDKIVFIKCDGKSKCPHEHGKDIHHLEL